MTRRSLFSLSSSWVRPRLPWRMALFLGVLVGMLWSPTRWLVSSVTSLHAGRWATPVALSRPNLGATPAWSARPITEIHGAPAGTSWVHFRLLAPAAKEVLLGGSFNDFDGARHPLERGAGGVWQRTLALAPGRYAYKFKVDGQWWLDPTNPEKTSVPTESSVMNVRSETIDRSENGADSGGNRVPSDGSGV